MNCSKVILALWLGATAWAQVVPQKQQANPPVAANPKPVPAASPAAPSPKPRASGASRTATPARAAKHAPHAAARRHVSHEKTAKTGEAAIGKSGVKGQRDPFVSPVVDRGRISVNCVGSGKQCLVVGEISLHGVVRGPSGFIAVVVNGEHTYFLRENDPLADGAVERITKDSIILRERYFDALGRPLTREVTRKLGVPAV